eukprot:SAG25_NODE_7551_length_473_cov_1.513369_1_plen_85_part_01
MGEICAPIVVISFQNSENWRHDLTKSWATNHRSAHASLSTTACPISCVTAPNHVHLLARCLDQQIDRVLCHRPSGRPNAAGEGSL